VVLVEGVSDQLALVALAERRDRDLRAERVEIVAMGGATNVRRYLEHYGPHGLDVTLAGLCDAGEEDDFRRALERAGIGSDLTRPAMEALGFYVCVPDLEAELIRALGPAEVERVIEAEGELGAFRTFQQQPAQRGRPPEAQLRRFMGTKGGRKIRCAPLLVAALDLARVPRPLDGVLGYVGRARLDGRRPSPTTVTPLNWEGHEMSDSDAPDTPVLDTLTLMTAASVGNCELSPRELMLVRLAALVAADAPPASYLANTGVAVDVGVTLADAQDVLVATAPIVGTARVVTAAGNIARALGIIIEGLVEAELEEELDELEAEDDD
jgi:hypothetical protein